MKMHDFCLEYDDHMGDDLAVVNAARVSLDRRHEIFEEPDDRKLIRYLARNNHWTPFGHVIIKVRIMMPIFVARQWYKSTIGTARCEDVEVVRNEVSRRYVSGTPEFFEFDAWRKAPEKSIKQGSGGVMDPEAQVQCHAIQRRIEQLAAKGYSEILSMGGCPEQARAILPQSMITQWIETGSLAFWARVYGLRSDPHAQKEIQAYAALINKVVKPICPISWGALTGENT